MVILENIDIDIDKAILQNIDIDKISNRFKFGISNRATLSARALQARALHVRAGKICVKPLTITCNSCVKSCAISNLTSKDPPSSLQISVKIRYQGTKPNGRLRRSTGIAIHCEYQPNQISEPSNQGPI